jgi:3-methyl-2-oxobutanoate hydroxymethyltransferase
MASKLTAPTIAARKVRKGDEPLVMLTAYDAPGARMVSEAGADLILVGDSLAMVVLGYEDTLKVTVDDMVHHTGAVARAKPDCFIVADLPWLSYHVSPADTVQNAARLVRAGAHAVKLEGGIERLRMIEAISEAEIPVMGHLGLTPQSVLAMGGFKVQGKSTNAAMRIQTEAKALAHAGCFAIVLEGVPNEVGKLVTDSLDIPTIGIGAGPDCDGQVLVFHDVLGIEDRMKPKFVRRYGSLKSDGVSALTAFCTDVRVGSFPADDECYHLSDEEAEALGLYGSPVTPSLTGRDDQLGVW